jgi:hypothetical protein
MKVSRQQKGTRFGCDEEKNTPPLILVEGLPGRRWRLCGFFFSVAYFGGCRYTS